jgi:hypothetical protein
MKPVLTVVVSALVAAGTFGSQNNTENVRADLLNSDTPDVSVTKISYITHDSEMDQYLTDCIDDPTEDQSDTKHRWAFGNAYLTANGGMRRSHLDSPHD